MNNLPPRQRRDPSVIFSGLVLAFVVFGYIAFSLIDRQRTPEPFAGFLNAILEGRNPMSFAYGPPRAALNTNLFAGMKSYRLVSKHHNTILVEVQLDGSTRLVRLHNLHGLVGRLDAVGGNSPPPR